MKKILFLLIWHLTIVSAFAQLKYKSNGTITDNDGKKISPREVRNLLSNDTANLNVYDSGRAKKSIGNVMMITGGLLLATDLLVGLNADVKYPGAITIIGGLAFLVAIPIKIGYSKKNKEAVNTYNSKNKVSTRNFKVEDIFICNNSNGIGLKITF